MSNKSFSIFSTLFILIFVEATIVYAQFQADSSQHSVAFNGNPMYQLNNLNNLNNDYSSKFDSSDNSNKDELSHEELAELVHYLEKHDYDELFRRDKKNKKNKQEEWKEENAPLSNHGRKTSLNENQYDPRSNCYNSISIESNKIIDSKTSIQNGAAFLGVDFIKQSSSNNLALSELQNNCIKMCCDSNGCDNSLLSLKEGPVIINFANFVYVLYLGIRFKFLFYVLKDGFRCYMFKCSDKCIYIKHKDYVVLRSKTPEQMEQSNLFYNQNSKLNTNRMKLIYI